ncbi:ABC transporter substrate-binding protein [Desulfopila sp. IMCC35008]|uniref:ABC transporter substrate-binding protein n=1 Tax=Desulfopila sp. IMCC35008 TaxID=2653858 RepID=UPI0013D08708|nr:ABC transporter substrate-binding protein [Desulfopila sp. IMCC35008]
MYVRRQTRVGKVLLACLFILFLIGIQISGCRDRKPIKIGFIAGTSGRVADLGISGRDAIQMVVEKYNQNGGINGSRIELVIRDDQQDPELVRVLTQELIDSGVVAIIGPMTSDMAMAVTPLLDKHQVVAISPTATTRLLSGRDDFLFKVSSTTLMHATKSAIYHINNTDVRRIAVIYDQTNSSFSEDWLKCFKDTFSANGGEIIATTGFDSSKGKSFTQISSEMLRHEPDGILIIANSLESAILCQQIRRVNPDISISLADWGATERLLELGGKTVEGVTVVQTFDRNHPGKRYQNFRREYLKRYNREPGFPGVYTYDATDLLLAALARQEGNNLKETILSIKNFPGLQSDFSFDTFGDVTRSHVSISVVQNGKFVVLE